MQMSDQTQTRVAIVTGSGGSIGKAICEWLLNDGFTVYGLDRDNALEHARFTFLATDLTRYATLPALLESEIEFGDENLLVNCAGIREILPIKDLSLEVWEQVMAVNLTAPFVLSQYFGTKVKEADLQGSIVNIASVAGTLGEPERTAYVVSKTGVIGLTKQLAIEFGDAGIRANSISPGVTRTNMTEQYFDDPEQVALIHNGLCLNRVGQPNDIASMVGFLSGQNAGFITGSNFIVDGGWTAGKQL